MGELGDLLVADAATIAAGGGGGVEVIPLQHLPDDVVGDVI